MSAPSWLRLAVVLMTLLVVQVAVLDQIVVLKVHADVMVLMPAAAGLIAGPQRGAIVGFVSGLFADLVVPLPYGLSALTFTLLGFGVGLLMRSPLGRDYPSVQIGACAAAATVGTAVYALLAAVVHQPGVLGVTTAMAIVVVGVGALVLAYPVIALTRWALAGATPSSFVGVGGSAIS